MKFLVVGLFFCVEIFECFNSCEGMYILNNFDVTGFYLKHEVSKRGSHPIIEYDLDRRKSLCEIYLKSASFWLVENESEFTEIRPNEHGHFNYQSQASEYPNFPIDALSYIEKIIRVSQTMVKIKMFLCSVSEDEVYMTSGFKLNYLFLIKKPVGSSYSDLAVSGMLESSATLDENFIKQRDNFSQYFWTNVKIAQGSDSVSLVVPSKMELCHVSVEQHFRLCSAVAEKISTFPPFNFGLRKTNFIVLPKLASADVRCRRKDVLRDDVKATASARVLPCAVNQDWENPQFYLLRDPNRSLPASVFVLRSVTGSMLRPEVQIDDVMALRDH